MVTLECGKYIMGSFVPGATLVMLFWIWRKLGAGAGPGCRMSAFCESRGGWGVVTGVRLFCFLLQFFPGLSPVLHHHPSQSPQAQDLWGFLVVYPPFSAAFLG